MKKSNDWLTSHCKQPHVWRPVVGKLLSSGCFSWSVSADVFAKVPAAKVWGFFDNFKAACNAAKRIGKSQVVKRNFGFIVMTSAPFKSEVK